MNSQACRPWSMGGRLEGIRRWELKSVGWAVWEEDADGSGERPVLLRVDSSVDIVRDGSLMKSGN